MKNLIILILLAPFLLSSCSKEADMENNKPLTVSCDSVHEDSGVVGTYGHVKTYFHNLNKPEESRPMDHTSDLELLEDMSIVYTDMSSHAEGKVVTENSYRVVGDSIFMKYNYRYIPEEAPEKVFYFEVNIDVKFDDNAYKGKQHVKWTVESSNPTEHQLYVYDVYGYKTSIKIK